MTRRSELSLSPWVPIAKSELAVEREPVVAVVSTSTNETGAEKFFFEEREQFQFMFARRSGLSFVQLRTSEALEGTKWTTVCRRKSFYLQFAYVDSPLSIAFHRIVVVAAYHRQRPKMHRSCVPGRIDSQTCESS